MAELGISNKGLAKRMRDAAERDRAVPIGCTHSTIARYLSGENRPRSHSLAILLDVLSQLADRPFAAADIGYPDMAVEMKTRCQQEFRPPRLTFAGVCMWCGRRGCNSRACIAQHLRSNWVVCSDCEGTLVNYADERPCGCVFGMIKAGE
ncbi:helix-turn-helix domain-containing protein [Nocardia sp. NPDC056100]|uniref:helix-turn-helix domain-containing protein n=1 Tax=Nocardia sp. NPDC056100 TaxID=3345712 RepID=UPI0035E39890